MHTKNTQPVDDELEYAAKLARFTPRPIMASKSAIQPITMDREAILSALVLNRNGFDTHDEHELYAIRTMDYVKIGRTKNIIRRLDELQSSSPLDLVVERHYQTTAIVAFTAERLLHAHLRHRWVRFEWFHIAPEEMEMLGIDAFIEKVEQATKQPHYVTKILRDKREMRTAKPPKARFPTREGKVYDNPLRRPLPPDAQRDSRREDSDRPKIRYRTHQEIIAADPRPLFGGISFKAADPNWKWTPEDG